MIYAIWGVIPTVILTNVGAAAGGSVGAFLMLCGLFSLAGQITSLVMMIYNSCK